MALRTVRVFLHNETTFPLNLTRATIDEGAWGDDVVTCHVMDQPRRIEVEQHDQQMKTSGRRWRRCRNYSGRPTSGHCCW